MRGGGVGELEEMERRRRERRDGRGGGGDGGKGGGEVKEEWKTEVGEWIEEKDEKTK